MGTPCRCSCHAGWRSFGFRRFGGSDLSNQLCRAIAKHRASLASTRAIYSKRTIHGKTMHCSQAAGSDFVGPGNLLLVSLWTFEEQPSYDWSHTGTGFEPVEFSVTEKKERSEEHTSELQSLRHL